MSTQALGWVLDHSPEEGAERLVLIAIANHADKKPDDDAWRGWPGVKTIQREARLRRGRTVQEVINRLITSGAIEREVNGGGDRDTRSDRRPNLYRIVMDHGVPCGDTRCSWCGVPRDAQRGAVSRPDGVPFDDATGCRETAPEPKEEPKEEPKRQSAPKPPTTPDPSVAELCEHLAKRIAQQSGNPLLAWNSSRWLTDMRRLLERGPTGRAEPQPFTVERVRRGVDRVFDSLAERGRDGFCWADQIRSPGALREKWDKLAEAYERTKPSREAVPEWMA